MTYIDDALAALREEFPDAEVRDDSNTFFPDGNGCAFSVRLPGWRQRFTQPVSVDDAHDTDLVREIFRWQAARVGDILTGRKPWAEDADGNPLYVRR